MYESPFARASAICQAIPPARRISIFEKLRAQAKSSQFPTPSSKTDRRAVCPGICFSGLGLEIWNFSGAWGLLLGVSLSGSSKTEKRPPLIKRHAPSLQNGLKTLAWFPSLPE